jgi:hypothetical protein
VLPDLGLAEDELRDRVGVAQGLPERAGEAVPDVDARVEGGRDQGARIGAELAADHNGHVALELEQLVLDLETI